MRGAADAAVVRSLRRASLAGAVACVLLGGAVLVGWAADISALKGLVPSFATMKPNSALGFIGLGTALWLRHTRKGDRLGPALTALVMLLGMLTLSEYVGGWSLGIDEVIFRDTALHVSRYPGRMSPVTAFDFTLLGAALLATDVRAPRSLRGWGEGATVLACLSALLSTLGYLYGVRSLYAVATFSSIALHTSLGFLVLALAVLLEEPERGVIQRLTTDSPTAVVSRRLLVAVVVVPAVLGWLRLHGERAGLYGSDFGVALFACSNIVTFAFLVWWSAGRQFDADRALQRSEVRFRRLSESGIIGIATADLFGKITDVNDTFLAIVGYSRDDFRAGRVTGASLNTPERAETDAPAMIQIRAEGIARAWEKELLHKDGHRIPVLAGAAMVDEGSGEVVSFILDLTELRRARAAVDALRREREADLEASIQLRDDFIAVAGHELKTPLSALLLQLQGLQRLVHRDHPSPPVEERIEKAVRSVLRLERLIKQLLDVSQIAAGLLRLESEPVRLADVVNDAVARLTDGNDARAMPVVVKCEAQADGQWDRLRLEQVVSNLVGNALKYGAGKPVEVELRTEDSDAILRVVDHGIGIDTAHQARVFQRFERAVDTRQYGGLGLGLWIAEQIVEASGGTIELESAPGEGTTFTVRLPMRRDGGVKAVSASD